MMKSPPHIFQYNRHDGLRIYAGPGIAQHMPCNVGGLCESSCEIRGVFNMCEEAYPQLYYSSLLRDAMSHVGLDYPSISPIVRGLVKFQVACEVKLTSL
jgi:hypothetical protein